MPNFLLLAKSVVFTKEKTLALSKKLGEDIISIEKMINAVIPLTLCAVIGKIKNVEDSAEIFFLSKKAAAVWHQKGLDFVVAEKRNINNLLAEQLTQTLLKNKYESLCSILSMHGRAKPSSARIVLSEAVYVCFVRLGILIAMHNFQEEHFKKWIYVRRNIIINDLPYDLIPLASTLGAEYDERAIPINTMQSVELKYQRRIRRWLLKKVIFKRIILKIMGR